MGGLGAASMGALAACSSSSSSSKPSCLSSDAVVQNGLSGLQSFTDWASNHSVSAEIGETGWPTGTAWTTFATTYLDTAHDAGAPVTAFASAPWWTASSPLAFYRSRNHTLNVDMTGTQAAPLEAAKKAGHDVGICTAEATFGTDQSDSGTYSSQQPGVVGSDYTYPSAATLAYLARRGHTRIRLAFGWERIQRSPFATLQARELSLLLASVKAAHKAGLEVVLDVHSYARYVGYRDGSRQVWKLGSDDLPDSAFADLWTRLATVFSGVDGVVGYDLMNEPHDLDGGAATWESASAAAVTAIRKIDTDTTLHVEGYGWSSADGFSVEHASPWIDDAHVVYSAHQYFDADGSGSYTSSYDKTRQTLATKVSCS